MFLNPSTWYQGPDQGPGTRNQGPRTRDLGPGTRDQRPRGGQKDAWEAALGGNLVKEDFGSKTSKFAEAFDEK